MGESLGSSPTAHSTRKMRFTFACSLLAAASLLLANAFEEEQFYDDADFANLIGKKVADNNKILKGLGSEDYVVLEDLPVISRVIRPGAVVTKEIREDRLNLKTDADGVIVDVEMG